MSKKFFFSPSTCGFYPDGDSAPADSILVTDEQRVTLLAAQSVGKVLGVDGGEVVARDAPSPPADELIKRQIVALESQQTPRRIREATLGIDNGWLAGIESQIETLRDQLGTL